MKISARNVLSGKVVKLTHGAVNSEVVLELKGGTQIVSMISRASGNVFPSWRTLSRAENMSWPSWSVLAASLR